MFKKQLTEIADFRVGRGVALDGPIMVLVAPRVELVADPPVDVVHLGDEVAVLVGRHVLGAFLGQGGVPQVGRVEQELRDVSVSKERYKRGIQHNFTMEVQNPSTRLVVGCENLPSAGSRNINRTSLLY